MGVKDRKRRRWHHHHHCPPCPAPPSLHSTGDAPTPLPTHPSFTSSRGHAATLNPPTPTPFCLAFEGSQSVARGQAKATRTLSHLDLLRGDTVEVGEVEEHVPGALHLAPGKRGTRGGWRAQGLAQGLQEQKTLFRNDMERHGCWGAPSVAWKETSAAPSAPSSAHLADEPKLLLQQGDPPQLAAAHGVAVARRRSKLQGGRAHHALWAGSQSRHGMARHGRHTGAERMHVLG